MQLVQLENNKLIFSKSINFDNCMLVKQQAITIIESLNDLKNLEFFILDLSNITQIDTSAIAIIIKLITVLQNKEIKNIHIIKDKDGKIDSLIKIYNLSDYFQKFF